MKWSILDFVFVGLISVAAVYAYNVMVETSGLPPYFRA